MEVIVKPTVVCKSCGMVLESKMLVDFAETPEGEYSYLLLEDYHWRGCKWAGTGRKVLRLESATAISYYDFAEGGGRR